MASPLNPIERALLRIVDELTEADVPYALVGGLAVSARAEPRTTRDVDMAVAVGSDALAEQLIYRLQNHGYVVKALLEQERTARIATVRLTRETERAVYVDLLFASSGIEDEIAAHSEAIVIVQGVTVRVATRAHLIALKVLARDDRHRPQDWDDLRALFADASQEDLQEVRRALGLIERRGYGRGRNLADDLLRAMAETTG